MYKTNKNKVLSIILIVIFISLSLSSTAFAGSLNRKLETNQGRIGTNNSSYQTYMKSKYGQILEFIYNDMIVNASVRPYRDGEIEDYDEFKKLVDEGRVYKARLKNSIFSSKFARIESVEDLIALTEQDDFPKVYNLVKNSYLNDNFKDELKPYYKDFYIVDWIARSGINSGNNEFSILTVRPYFPYKVNHVIVDYKDNQVVNKNIYLTEEGQTLHLDYNKLQALEELKSLGYKLDENLNNHSLSEKIANSPDKEYNLYYSKESVEEVEDIEIEINYGYIDGNKFINFKDSNTEDIKETLTFKREDKISSKDIDIKEIKGYKFQKISPDIKEAIEVESLTGKNIYVIYNKEEIDKETKYNLKVIARNSKTNENIGDVKLNILDKKSNKNTEYILDSSGSLVIEGMKNGSYEILPEKLKGYTSLDKIEILIENKDKEKIIFYTPKDKEPTNPEPNPGTDPETTPERPDPPYIPETIKPEETQKLPEDQLAIVDEEKLNKIDHFNYIQGYSDNTIRADKNITREEVAAVFFRLLDNDYKEKVRSNKNPFLDISDTRWSNKHISSLNKAKILTGYKDNKFKPKKYITRAEVATIASRFDNLEENNNSFLDTKGHWAEKYISSAAKKGWVKGYKDNTFKPDEYITRGEFVTLVNGVLNRKIDKDSFKNINKDKLNNYKDLDSSKWYYYDLVEAVNGHKYNEERIKDNIELWIKVKDFNVEM